MEKVFKFIKENWFKISIIIIFIVVASVYLNIQNSKEEKSSLVSMKEKCKELGEQAYRVDSQADDELGLLVPQFGYNKELDTCLYSGGWVRLAYVNRWVKDVLANKELISLVVLKGKVSTAFCDTCVHSVEEFERRKQELFNQ